MTPQEQTKLLQMANALRSPSPMTGRSLNASSIYANGPDISQLMQPPPQAPVVPTPPPRPVMATAPQQPAQVPMPPPRPADLGQIPPQAAAAFSDPNTAATMQPPAQPQRFSSPYTMASAPSAPAGFSSPMKVQSAPSANQTQLAPQSGQPTGQIPFTIPNLSPIQPNNNSVFSGLFGAYPLQ